uniref:Putative secreted salivary gland peptide n=1 Tax=Ixodes ricinus TaxID=34613 RepID=A0A090XBB1_IXORI
MCRNISNMLLVLFAVLLSLPESKGKGSEILLSECYPAVKKVGDIICTLYGYGRFESLIYRTCQLVCGERYVQLPEDACSEGCARNLHSKAQKYNSKNGGRRGETVCSESVIEKRLAEAPGISAVAEDCAVFSLGPDLL